MEFTSKQQAKRQVLRAELETVLNQLHHLEKEIALEKSEVITSLKTQGWVEINSNDGDEEYCSYLHIAFSPSVPASVIELAQSEAGYFDPEEAGLKPEEYFW